MTRLVLPVDYLKDVALDGENGSSQFKPAGRMRWVAAALLGGVAVGSAFVAWGVLSNRWVDDPEVPETSLLFGIPLVLLAVFAAVAVGLLLHRRS